MRLTPAEPSTADGAGMPAPAPLLMSSSTDVDEHCAGLGRWRLNYDQISSGAPLGLAWPDVVPFNSLGTCIPKITVDNEALAQVFFAWRNIEGEWLRAQMGSGGARPFFAPEADKFPLAKIAREAGITEARLAQPKTPADFDKVEDNRKVAIDGMKAGVQSGQKVPYP